MRQFLDVKERYPDAIVFFRLGDFYEMFFEDAVVAAPLLDLTLTTRDKGKDDPIPMAGVPHHAARGYIAKLTGLGHKVVICEQTEDARHAKGLVKREVVRVVTPGVVLDEEALDPKVARYLAAVVPGGGGGWGLAYLDVTTGEFAATELASLEALADELTRVAPSEVLAPGKELAERGRLGAVRRRWRVPWRAVEAPSWERGLAALKAAVAIDPVIPDKIAVVEAAATTLAYAAATQPTGTLPLARLSFYDPGAVVVLDESAIANLELTETLIGGKREGSLLAVLDDTRTAGGARQLRRWLLYPLREVATIRRRHDAVEWLVARPKLRGELRRTLSSIHDLDRLIGRVSLGVAGPRDLARLRDSLGKLPELVAPLGDGDREVLEGLPELLDGRALATPALGELCGLLGRALVDEPPPFLKDGGVIRGGYDRQVDESRRLADGGKDEITAIEAREREATGIASLKVRYNRVFGYYLEITKSHLARVPTSYIRKQTVATGERYVTPELAELEQRVLSAEETLIDREQQLFAELVARARATAREVAAAAAAVSTLDVLVCFAERAHHAGFVRPTVDDDRVIEIGDGRHPVIEAIAAAGTFVPNDCRLDVDGERLLLITGPNMAGKSTYMRQVAHIVLLAQVGSFVPARSARIGVCDRIFTRVGAADNLSRGDSTFMVEMRETAAILAGATDRSLVLLDEVGRGTSTFDGLSIAWAVAERLHDLVKARTLFATHYHELTALAESRTGIRNVSMAVREHQGEIVFLRRVVAGGASQSYGIDVARLAGLPAEVIARARERLVELEGGDPKAARGGRGPSKQLSLLATAPDPVAPPILEELRALDPNRMTPIEALSVLAKLVDKSRQG